ncbi:MAG TPA: hypothetical protein VKV73_00750 [Chloroflexota bacterium]|nr:hypothetical protein [Chloroflexota bacterium]
MNSARLSYLILPAIITLLALADGALHFSLDVVLFRGNFFGALGPPPGAPSGPPPGARPGPPIPLPLPLNQMFVLNLVGYVVLVALFWFVLTQRRQWLRWLDALLVVYVVGCMLAWAEFGAPNPRGLGYLSKGTEAVLVVTLVVHFWMLSRTAASRFATPPGALAAHH